MISVNGAVNIDKSEAIHKILCKNSEGNGDRDDNQVWAKNDNWKKASEPAEDNYRLS